MHINFVGFVGVNIVLRRATVRCTLILEVLSHPQEIQRWCRCELPKNTIKRQKKYLQCWDHGVFSMDTFNLVQFSSFCTWPHHYKGFFLLLSTICPSQLFWFPSLLYLYWYCSILMFLSQLHSPISTTNSRLSAGLLQFVIYHTSSVETLNTRKTLYIFMPKVETTMHF